MPDDAGIDPLEGLPSRELTFAEADALAKRLEADPTLRASVDEMLAGQTLVIDSTARHEMSRLPPSLTAVIHRLKADPPVNRASPLSLLSPPEGPDELGRLGGYRVRRVLGEGGMGVVFEAYDSRLNRRVGLKVIRPEFASAHHGRERFFREARAAAALKDDHIVTLYEIGEANGQLFLVMEYLEGQSLHDRLKKGGPLSVPEILHIGREVAEGLQAAHRQAFVHRDIKPANIWLETVGSERWAVGSEESPGTSSFLPTVHRPLPTFRVKILDFGLARPVAGDDVELTRSGIVVGTPAYMAPEQGRGLPVDHRADLFSLGVVLYEMTTGRRPFRGPDAMAILTSLALDTPPAPRVTNPSLPPALSDLVMALLAKDPADRPADARAVAEALQRIEDCAEKTAVVPVSDRPTRRSRRSLVAACGVALVALAIVVARFRDTAADPPPALPQTPKNEEFAQSPSPRKDEHPDPDVPLRPGEVRRIKWNAPTAEITAFSPDGSLVATAEHRNRATIWDARTGNKVIELRCLRAHFLPTGEVLGSQGDRYEVYDLKTGRVKREFGNGHKGLFWTLLSPDGRLMMAHGDRSPLVFWDVKEGKKVSEWDLSNKALSSYAFSPDGKILLVIVDDSRPQRAFDIAAGKEVAAYPDLIDKTQTVYLLPGGKEAWCESTSRFITVRDLEGREIDRLDWFHELNGVRLYGFNPAFAKFLYAFHEDNTVAVYESRTGKEVARTPLPDGTHPASWALSDDGTTMFIGFDGGEFLLWRLP